MTTSSTLQAPGTIQGTITQLNRGGVKVGDTWFNYPRGTADQAKLSKEAVGALVVLAIVMVEGKPMIGSVQRLEKAQAPAPAAAAVAQPAPAELPAAPSPAPAPQAPAGPGPWTAHPATDGQKQKIQELAESLGISSQMVNLILKLRFKDEAKSVATLKKGEASKVIQFLDAEMPQLPVRGRRS